MFRYLIATKENSYVKEKSNVGQIEVQASQRMQLTGKLCKCLLHKLTLWHEKVNEDTKIEILQVQLLFRLFLNNIFTTDVITKR